jgi:hypothetical protein
VATLSFFIFAEAVMKKSTATYFYAHLLVGYYWFKVVSFQKQNQVLRTSAKNAWLPMLPFVTQ